MMGNAQGLVRFSSRDMLASGSGEASVEDVYSNVTRMNIMSTGDVPLEVDMSVRLLHGTALAAITGSPYRIERTLSQTKDGNDDFVLTIVRRGGISAQQPGRSIGFGAGEAYLFLNDKPILARAPQGAQLLNIAVPCAFVTPLVANIAASLNGALPASIELGLLAGYADGLLTDALLTPETAAMAGSHLRDLVIAVLGTSDRMRTHRSSRGVRAARLAAIKRDILQALSDPALSINTMAIRHDISPHYIRALFSGDGTAFTDYVREQRLMAAFRCLSDPRSAMLTISTIAYDCGFTDLSWFNQTFKRRFGQTPSDIRNDALRRTDGQCPHPV